MKNVIISLLLVGALFSVTFSMATMNHMNGQGHNLCPFEAMGVTNCAQVQNSFDLLTSHLNTLAKFFSAPLANGFVVSLSALIALVFVIFFGFGGGAESLTLRPVFFRSRFREFFVAPSRILFNHWFSLHENSPASLVRR